MSRYFSQLAKSHFEGQISVVESFKHFCKETFSWINSKLTRKLWTIDLLKAKQISLFRAKICGNILNGILFNNSRTKKFLNLSLFSMFFFCSSCEFSSVIYFKQLFRKIYSVCELYTVEVALCVLFSKQCSS